MSINTRLGKSTLSLYLRTNCDRELFFSLFKSNSSADLISAGIPTPLSARPNIQLIRDDGIEYELAEYEMLIKLLGANHVRFKKQATKFTTLNLQVALQGITVPGVCIEPAIDPESFRTPLLQNDFGLTPLEASQIPTLSDMRPDVIIVRHRGTLEWEVLANGRRSPLQEADTRKALSVVDIKNVTESNKSYAAEVVLYSLVLAKWLDVNGLADQFFVSDECFVWTNRERVALDSLAATASKSEKIQTLVESLDKVEFSVVAPSVIKFFKEDVPRVMTLGQNSGWQAIDYHVGARCSGCDWLGYEQWLSTTDKALLQNNPDWYCKPAAQIADHLSRLPAISKGARKVLEAGSIPTLTSLSVTPSTHASLREHSFLKKDRSQLHARASAILTNQVSIDSAATVAGLASFVDIQISIAVNFDSAAGLLTGIALRATQFSASGITHLNDSAVVIEDDNHRAEWNALHSFLTALDSVFSTATNAGNPRTQIYFWEKRQFEELCAAVGRHLPQILALPRNGRRSNGMRALVWLFPPDELIKRNSAYSPHIIFLGELAKRVVRTTNPHAFTLHSTFECYHYPSLAPRPLDRYFVDPLGNGIPRERIFEVWKNSGTIRSGGKVKTKTEAAAEYMKALKAQSLGIASISARMRHDFRAQLKGTAKRLDVGALSGARSVAFDSKLWIEWARISASTSAVERKAEYTLSAEVLEASFKAIVLTARTGVISTNQFTFDVSPESRETKLDDAGAYFVLGDAARPGFPLETPSSLGIADDPASFGGFYHMNIAYLIRVEILQLDRARLTAEIVIHPRSSKTENGAIVRALIANNVLPITGDLFLMDGPPYDDANTVEGILRQVGNPLTAAPDAHAIAALAATSVPRTGTDPITPLAEILWSADALATKVTRDDTTALTLANRANFYVGDTLNQSQQDAIKSAASRKLSLIWGPPGTGKTSTLVAYLLAIIEEGELNGLSTNILLVGPNYKATEVLVHRLVEALDKHPTLTPDLFMVYSRSKPITDLPSNSRGIAQAVQLGNRSIELGLRTAYQGNRVSLFGTTAHNAHKLANAVLGFDGTLLLPRAFDLIILDESSQVPITLALNPLGTLKPNSEVVISGDRKQMPPIQALPPPIGAEHLVGSIHSYLVTRFRISEQPLLVNYRSADHLVEYARMLGYPRNLSAHVPNRRIQLLVDPTSISLPNGFPFSSAWASLLDPEKVVNTVVYEDIKSSQANAGEAKMVASIVFLLKQCAAKDLAPQTSNELFLNDEDFFRRGVGIVTPHKAQRAAIISELTVLFPGVDLAVLQESVDTVEKFQGGERHTIIVSFGVGDVDVIEGEEEFLFQLERINVSISRAMAKCIVILPKTLAYHLPSDAKVAHTATALKSYTEEFCFNRMTYSISTGGTVEVRWK